MNTLFGKPQRLLFWFGVLLAMAGWGISACGGEGRQRPGAVAGTVTLSDSEDASGVTVKAGGRETTTPASGSYTLAGLAAGEVTVTASKPNYEPVSKTVKVPEGGSTNLDVSLELANLPPQIATLSIDPRQMKPGEPATVEVDASDPNGDELDYTFNATDGFTVVAGEGGTATVTAPDEFGRVGQLTVTVTDPDGQSVSDRVEVTTVQNRSPVINDLRALPAELRPGGRSALTVSATDADGDPLSYAWEAPDGWALGKTDALRTEITAPDSFEAEAEVKVTVEDAYGETDSATVTLRTAANQPPRIASIEAVPPQAKPGGTMTLKVEAVDPEDGELSVSWSGPQEWAIGAPKSKVTTVTAPMSYGERARIRVQVSDAEGAVATGDILVSTPENDGPRIAALSASPTSVVRGGEVVAVATASDPNGDSLSVKWDVSAGWTLTKDPNNPMRAAIKAPPKPGSTGVIQVEVSDPYGGLATASTTVSTQANRPPSIGSMAASKTTLERGGRTLVTVAASDPDGDTLKYAWSAPQGWTITKKSGTDWQVEVKAPDQWGATAVVAVTVTDDHGGKTVNQVVLTTEANKQPVVSDLKVTPDKVRRGGMIAAEVIASDPEGEKLSYTWSIGGQGWSVKKDAQVGSRATVASPSTPKVTATLQVIVKDAYGNETKATKLVETKPNSTPTITAPSADWKLADAANPSPISHSRTWSYELKAQDPEGDPVTWSASGAPNLVVDNKAGLLKWTPPTSEQGKTFTITITADDGLDKATRTVELKCGALGFQFTKPVSIKAPRSSWNGDGVTFGDVNADGFKDAVYVDYRRDDSSDLSVAYGSKDGFTKLDAFHWNTSADYCVAPALGDVDGDKDVDVFVLCDEGRAGGDELNYYVWKNDGTGKFTPGERHYWSVTDGHYASDVELGDLDGDGDLDAVAVGDEAFVIGRNDGNGSFRSRDFRYDYYNDYYQVEIADMDGGGRPEIIVTYRYGRYRRGYVDIWTVDSNANLQSRPERYTLGSSYEYPYVMGVRDLNKDGRPDVVVLDNERDNIILLENRGNNQLSRRVNQGYSGSTPGYQYGHLDFGDFDKDGHTDVVFGTTDNLRFNIAYGQGGMGLRTVQQYAVPAGYNSADLYGVFSDDWDRDGDDDVLFGTHGQGQVGVAY